jgi:CRP-like cAMP-binding protein
LANNRHSLVNGANQPKPMFSHLHHTISQYVQLNDKERQIFESAFTYREVPKNFTLVDEGQIPREVYFINKGLLRLYYPNDGEFITAFIFREHLFAASYDSFLQSIPATQCLDTLEDAELLVLTKDKLDELYTTVPKINVMTRRIAEERFINAQRILSSFLLDSHEERYRKFAEQNGDLFLRVPHHIIASYLGITPVSLSRIRKRILHKR